jgi:predicted aconitase
MANAKILGKVGISAALMALLAACSSSNSTAISPVQGATPEKKVKVSSSYLRNIDISTDSRRFTAFKRNDNC